MTAKLTTPKLLDQSQFLDLVRLRRSTRSFSSKPVSEDEVAALIEAARWAPSPSNRQPWKFLSIAARPCIDALRTEVEAGCQILLQKRAGQDARAVEEYLQNFTH